MDTDTDTDTDTDLVLTAEESAIAAAEAWGYRYSEFSAVEKRTWKNQTRYLEQYSLTRTKIRSARHAGVSSNNEFYWARDDALSWRARLAQADAVFIESLEELALHRVQLQTPGQSPLLLITLLNAHHPARYRGTQAIEDSARDIVGAIMKLGKDRNARAKVVDQQGKAVEEVTE